MEYSLKTSWMLIQGASAGERQAREEFARRYAPVVRAYLNARWQDSPLQMEIEDATQEVFFECFKQGGLLGKADQERPGGFRAFFFGAVRNVAQRIEKRAVKKARISEVGFSKLDRMPDSGESLSRVFDRAWARSIMKEAAALHATRARAKEDGSERRIDLLNLRFHEGMPIREIAELWNVDSAFLHREYARARKEFEACLKEILALENPNATESIDKMLADLLVALQ